MGWFWKPSSGSRPSDHVRPAPSSLSQEQRTARREAIIQERTGDIIAVPGDIVSEVVVTCLREILLVEDQHDWAPRETELLPDWRARKGLPSDLSTLSKEVEDRFRVRRHELERYEKILWDGERLFNANRDLIEKFLEIAERKVSVIDEYGEDSWGSLPAEVIRLVEKVALRQGAVPSVLSKLLLDEGPDYPFPAVSENRWQEFAASAGAGLLQCAVLADRAFRQQHDKRFGSHVEKLLRDAGFVDVRDTEASGRSELIAQKSGRTVLIVAKRCGTLVDTNVVFDAGWEKSLHKTDEAWVVTNSSFTAAARNVAHKKGVRLFDGHALASLSSTLRTWPSG